ncbi:MAG TPA: D-2-hydroxyacid dehydrogenase [Verrucomicrobiae bacterium]|nr:D-2-hydroxyacid dehydrogenase [Verrucomicrobiae bacterium]
MRIVVLDGFTLNPGDLTWDALRELGPAEIYDRSGPAELLPRAAFAEVLLTNKTLLDRQTIGKLPQLRYIGVLATGTNVVDLEAARERAIPVTNVPAYGTASVAQATLALLLELTNGVGHHAQTVRSGRWSQQPDFCYWEQPLIELSGLSLGIIGFGRIGRAMANLAHALGMNILVSTSALKSPPAFVRPVDLETLFRQSDVVTLHCPLTPETKELVNAQRLSWMKPTSFLLNTSRGALIDEPVLAEALNAGRIAGAGLDVLSQEPPLPENPLLQARNCLITPHCAWGTRAARQRLMKVAVENVRAFLNGHPQNVVN